jgi:lipopolysaccharide cholinephosphotransferase
MNLTDLLLKYNCGMREMSFEESSRLKKVLLEIYRDIQFVCKINGLNVLLGGGSCLGAVRHNGYIPWDDDLDILMERKDYNRFPDLLKKEFGDKYRCVGPNVSEIVEFAYIKVEKIGTELRTIYDLDDEHPAISIDVFPIDNIPNNKIRRFFHGMRINFLMYVAVCVKLYAKRNNNVTRILLSEVEGRKFIRKRLLIGRLFSFYSYTKWYTKCEKCVRKFEDEYTLSVSIPTGREHYFGEIQDRSVFFPSVEHRFEELVADIPNGYDKYLSALYGDYMQIPPIEKREKHFIVNISF